MLMTIIIRPPARSTDLPTAKDSAEPFRRRNHCLMAMLEAYARGRNIDRGAAAICVEMYPPPPLFESYRKRGSDLEKLGWVRNTGEQWIDPETKKNAEVREITQLGLEELGR
jgi:hypothetical protein